MKLLCLDGNSILNRAFYAIKLLTTKDGRYTNAIHGFMSVFVKLIDKYQPDAVAIAFDERAKTFRHKMYDGYKATRKGMPEELASQMPVLKELLTLLGYTYVTAAGYEADDILGTFAESCKKRGDICLIATGDRDSLQLVSDATTVLLTTTKAGHGETDEITPAVFAERYNGLEPKQLIELKALMGDSSDNIPGVAGVGEKTALDLISRFASLEGVYENIEDESIKTGVRAKLEKDKETAYLSRVLATINDEVPIDTDPASYVKAAGEPQKAAALLGSLEMHTMVSRLKLGDLPATAVAPAAEEKKKELKTVEITDGVFAELKKLDKIFLLEREGVFYSSFGENGWRLDKATLEEILKDDIPKYFFDVKKFWHAALEGGYEIKNAVFDLKLAAYLLSPASAGYEPSALAAEYSTEKSFECDVDALSYIEPLCGITANMLEKQGMRKLHDEIELPFSRVLAEMETAGFAVDKDGIGEFGRELIALIEKKQEEIYSLAGKKFNINSPKQLGEVLFDDLGLPALKMNKSGYATDAETLDKLSESHPIINKILNYRTYQKLNSTYVEGLMKAVDTSGRIHTEFMQTETRTGRISSREPNLQNIPVRTELGARFRKYFVAPAGRVLCDADYSQIELRVLASISDDKLMSEAFLQDRDIHTETASEIFKVPREQVSSELRRRAKAVNFGIVYGIGAFSLAKDVGVSVSEAKQYIEDYLATYSGVAGYLKKTVEQATRDGFVTTAYGRRRVLPELLSSNKNLQALGKRLAMNTPIQGTAADIIKIAMIKVSERVRAEKLDARLVLQVHDELIIEASEKDGKRAATVLKEEMERAANLTTPLAVDVGTGATWSEAKL